MLVALILCALNHEAKPVKTPPIQWQQAARSVAHAIAREKPEFTIRKFEGNSIQEVSAISKDGRYSVEFFSDGSLRSVGIGQRRAKSNTQSVSMASAAKSAYDFVRKLPFPAVDPPKLDFPFAHRNAGEIQFMVPLKSRGDYKFHPACVPFIRVSVSEATGSVTYCGLSIRRVYYVPGQIADEHQALRRANAVGRSIWAEVGNESPIGTADLAFVWSIGNEANGTFEFSKDEWSPNRPKVSHLAYIVRYPKDAEVWLDAGDLEIMGGVFATPIVTNPKRLSERLQGIAPER